MTSWQQVKELGVTVVDRESSMDLEVSGCPGKQKIFKYKCKEREKETDCRSGSSVALGATKSQDLPSADRKTG